MKEKTAKFIKQLDGTWTGDARLYKVEPPMEDYSGNKYDYVIVSATYAPFSGPETYIFPANEEGDVLSWEEMEGSFKGEEDHEQALNEAGYALLKYH